MARTSFNPRPREGSDRKQGDKPALGEKFQSTPPRRERPVGQDDLPRLEGVSIHAPAKGATRAGREGARGLARFNPRPREGSDPPHGWRPAFPAKFQSTPPRRERPRTTPPPPTSSCFNPRPREGSDTSSHLRIAKWIAFQSTPPRRERRGWSLTFGRFLRFQSTPPRRERPSTESSPWSSSGFNPRPREGSDVVPSPSSLAPIRFNPRPREGSDVPRWASSPAAASFNPRPREGSDGMLGRRRSHLPAFQSTPPRRERLVLGHGAAQQLAVSIHAPAKGATRGRPPRPTPTGFQSTPPRRERLGRFALGDGRHPVSIHAPAKGATSSGFTSRASARSFNPRPREGSDVQRIGDAGVCWRFQSTPPRRERPPSGMSRLTPERFQSTPPRRERPLKVSDAEDMVWVSIHAPAKGATGPWHWHGRGFGVSIHAPAKGATWTAPPTSERRRGFNPRPREGSDVLAALFVMAAILFQSTPPRRERRSGRRCPAHR